jgi:hypothetical protein
MQVIIAKNESVVSNVDIIIIDFKKKSIVVINFCTWKVMLGKENFIIGNEAGSDLLVSRKGKSINFRAREK